MREESRLFAPSPQHFISTSCHGTSHMCVTCAQILQQGTHIHSCMPNRDWNIGSQVRPGCSVSKRCLDTTRFEYLPGKANTCTGTEMTTKSDQYTVDQLDHDVCRDECTCDPQNEAYRIMHETPAPMTMQSTLATGSAQCE